MGLFDFSGLQDSVRKLAAQVKGIRANLEQLRRQRDALQTAPAARADVKAAIAAQVAANADRFHAMIVKSLAPFVHKPAMLADAEKMAGVFGLLAAMAPGGVPTPRATDLVLCGVAGDRVTSALCTAVDEMEWPAPEGLPMAQRAAELDKLDRRIAELESQEAQLVREARSAGIVLED